MPGFTSIVCQSWWNECASYVKYILDTIVVPLLPHTTDAEAHLQTSSHLIYFVEGEPIHLERDISCTLNVAIHFMGKVDFELLPCVYISPKDLVSP